MGQYYDEESGLHYNRYRYYDPATTQYISPDPIGLAGGINSYGYVHNPLSWIDPLGLAGSPGTNKSQPDFIVDPSGVAYPVPKGAIGPTPVINPTGKQTGVAYVGGKGGKNGQVSTMRVMDPTPPRGKSPGYPNGYIKYENSAKQGVDPYTGKTIPNKESHFPINPRSNNGN